MLVGIIDSQPLVIRGLQSIFESISDIDVLASGDDYECVEPTQVDVLLLDSLLIGETRGLGSLQALARQTNVLVVAAESQLEETDAYLLAGAKGRIDRRASPEEVVQAVRAVGAGGRITHVERRIGVDLLSTRERNVLCHIAQGFTHDQTARRLSISKHTVDTYVKRARVKLNLGNKAELTRVVLRALHPNRCQCPTP